MCNDKANDYDEGVGATHHKWEQLHSVWDGWRFKGLKWIKHSEIGTADLDELEYDRSKGGFCFSNFTLSAASQNPLQVGAPTIDYEYDITVHWRSKSMAWVTIRGDHDNYPAHEIFVNDKRVHGWKPGADDDVTNLIPGGGIRVAWIGPIDIDCPCCKCEE